MKNLMKLKYSDKFKELVSDSMRFIMYLLLIVLFSLLVFTVDNRSGNKKQIDTFPMAH